MIRETKNSQFLIQINTYTKHNNQLVTSKQ